jgi:hypothetical protein
MSNKPNSLPGTLASSNNDGLKAVRFPAERSMGALWVRERSLDSYTFWEPCGNAQGIVTVPAGKELRLNATPQASTDLSPLSALQSEDLQYLQLSSSRVINAGLRYLRGLTGLRVLWLYDTPIGDDGLVHLQALTGLRVLNLRSTLVSKEGIDALQQALPQCEIRRPWK